MIRFATCVALLFPAGLVNADEPKKDEWVKIAPEKEKYEFQFPAKPKDKVGMGSAQYLLEREGGKAVLLVLVTPMPMGIDVSKAEIVKPILDNGRDSLLKSLKGSKILSEKETMFNKKYPQRDIDVDVPALGLYRTRFILTPESFYQVNVVGPKDFVDSAEAKKFMKSFKLKD